MELACKFPGLLLQWTLFKVVDWAAAAACVNRLHSLMQTLGTTVLANKTLPEQIQAQLLCQEQLLSILPGKIILRGVTDLLLVILCAIVRECLCRCRAEDNQYYRLWWLGMTGAIIFTAYDVNLTKVYRPGRIVLAIILHLPSL
jgi:hypothetical protein